MLISRPLHERLERIIRNAGQEIPISGVGVGGKDEGGWREEGRGRLGDGLYIVLRHILVPIGENSL